jgi:hypothetical protein
MSSYCKAPDIQGVIRKTHDCTGALQSCCKNALLIHSAMFWLHIAGDDLGYRDDGEEAWNRQESSGDEFEEDEKTAKKRKCLPSMAPVAFHSPFSHICLSQSAWLHSPSLSRRRRSQLRECRYDTMLSPMLA